MYDRTETWDRPYGEGKRAECSSRKGTCHNIKNEEASDGAGSKSIGGKVRGGSD